MPNKNPASLIEVLRKWLDKHFADEEALLLLLLVALGLWAVVKLGHVLSPFIASLIIAYLLQGFVERLTRFGASYITSVVIVFVSFIAVVVIAFVLLIPLAWHQLRNLGVELPHMVSQGQHVLMTLPEQYPELISPGQFDNLMLQVKERISGVGQNLVSISFTSLPNVLAVAVYLVVVPILVFFLLKDKDLLMERLVRFLPEERPILQQVWNEMNVQIANYIRGKALQMLIVSVATLVAFYLFGLKYSVLLAVLVGLSVIIPYIGPILVTVPVVMVAYFQWSFGPQFFWLCLIYLLVQAIDGYVIVPILFSEAVNLHPIVIIMAVLVFGSMWGFWGVFFAIPLATLIKAVIRAWPSVDAIQ